MAYTIIDRTLNGKRASGNRNKFIRRVRRSIAEQVNKQVADGNIDDLVSGKGKKVSVSRKTLSQPKFKHGAGGKREFVLPGNKEYSEGDRIARPPSGGGQGQGKAGKDGEGEDSFEFTLTHDEFVDMFFEDCELPDLKDTVITKTDKFAMRRAGFSTDGPMAQLNLPRTMRMSKGRRIGLMRKGKKKDLLELQTREAEIIFDLAELEIDDGVYPPDDSTRVQTLKNELNMVRDQIVVLRRKLRAVPFIDDVDLRFNKHEKVPIPTSQAVMFCVMDVSGSMGQTEKELAKRYFMLLYLFLTRNYERVEVVWIRHHTIAKEVNEDEFFHSRETGGTLVSTALDLVVNIIDSRYSPEEWNIYASQVSDGDNWHDDTHVALDVLRNKILPVTQYYTYIEAKPGQHNRQSDLWPQYELVAKQFNNFQMKVVKEASDIYPVFQQLFKKNKRVQKDVKAKQDTQES